MGFFQKKTIEKAIAIVILATIVLSAMLMFLDIEAIFLAMQGIQLKKLMLVGLFIPCNYGIKLFRYRYYLKRVKVDVQIKDQIFSLFSSFIMTITPGKFGEMLLRGYILKERGYHISTLTVCAMTLADRLTEGLAMVAFTLLTLSAFDGISSVLSIVALGIGLILFVCILQNKALSRWVTSFL